MRQHYKFDDDGYYLYPVIALYTDDNPMPANITDVRPKDGLYLGKWTGTEWIETAPQPETGEGEIAVWDSELRVWNVIPEPAAEPSIEERLKDISAAVSEMAEVLFPGLKDRLDTCETDIHVLEDAVFGEKK
jgi:hypothetical protein